MHKIFIPKRIFIFSEPPPPPPQIKINKWKYKILNPPKIAQAYVCMKISEYPAPLPLWFECLTLLKIEVIEYGKKGFKMAWNAFSEA